MEHPFTLSRSFIIGILLAAVLFVVLGERASAQSYTSFFESYLQPSYTLSGIQTFKSVYTPPSVDYAPPSGNIGERPPYHYYQPYYPNPVYYPRYRQPTYPRYRSPFGPLPGPICGDPWTTPGLGLAGDDIPLRVCVL